MSGKDELQIVNMYSRLHRKYLPNTIKYRNYRRMRINLPARIAVIGSSGSGKTNLVVNLIRLFNCFSKIYLFARNLDEPLYKFLRDWFAKIEKKAKIQIFFYSNDIGEIPPVETMDPRQNNLVLFDDLINDKNLGKSNVPNYFTMGRKMNVTTIFISQSWFKIPQIIRQNLQYIILKKISSLKDLGRMIAENNLELDPKAFKRLYNQCVQTLGDFMLIDLDSPPQLKWRCGFEPIDIQPLLADE